MSVSSVAEQTPGLLASAFMARTLRETKDTAGVLLMLKIVDVPCSVFF